MAIWWYEKLVARANGKRDGRIQMPFNQGFDRKGKPLPDGEGYPQFAMQLRDRGENAVKGLVDGWHRHDGPLSETHRDVAHQMPRLKQDEEAAKSELARATKEFEAVRGRAGCAGAFLRWPLGLAIAFAEIIVNFEATKYLLPGAPDFLNLGVAFLLSAIFVVAAEFSGRWTKQGRYAVAVGVGLLGVGVISVFGWKREEAVEATRKAMEQAGVLLRSGAESSASGIAVSIALGLLFFGVAFAAGYAAASTDEQYDNIANRVKAAGAKCRSAARRLQRTESRLRRVEAKRVKLQAKFRHRSGQQIDSYQFLAGLYLQHYNRAASQGQRRRYPDPELPIGEPPDLHDPARIECEVDGAHL
jgi:hypothetical protein